MSFRAPAGFMAVFLIAAPFAVRIPAQCETQRLLAADGKDQDRFASAIARWDDRVIVGSVFDDGIGEDSGSAYIFEQQGEAWVQVAKLIPSDETADDRFGWSVAIWEDVAVVGARYNDDAGYGSGSAYVFERIGGTWTETAYLTASDEAFDAFFGQCVGVSDGVIVVGAMFGDGPPDVASGAAYVFRKVGGVWTETQKLFGSDAEIHDRFGTSVAITERTMVVGARGTDHLGPQAGAAYVFELVRGSFVQTAILHSPQQEDGELFGAAVAVWGDVILVSSLLEDAVGHDAGAVYVFEKQGGVWSQTGRLVPNDSSELTYFGSSVAVWNHTALVGAWADADKGNRSGAVYVFEKRVSGWEQADKMWPDDAQSGLQFGESIGLWDDAVVVGASGAKNATGVQTGSAYAFKDIGAIVDYGAGSPGTGGVVPYLGVAGCASPGGSLSVSINRAHPDSLALLLLGIDQSAIPLVGCTLLVFPLLPLQLALPLNHLGEISVTGSLPASVGLPFSFTAQAFVFDAGGALGFSATNAVEVTLAP